MNRDSVKTILKNCGEDVFISDMAEIKRPELVEIGNHVAIDSFVYISTGASIGDYVHISPHVSCIGGKEAKLVLGGFNTISAGARLICMGDEHLGLGLVGPMVPKQYSDKLIGSDLVIERFANIASNAVILPGLKVGEGSVIGAGSILTCDAEPWTIYVGSPARPVKKRRSDQMLAFAKELGY
jgi:galactoside O-acetyltransferase